MDAELQTVSQVSRHFGVSTRMLRYYEQAGLLHSQRLPGYAYRVYSAEAQKRLRQILLLRKLRIPVKEIKSLLLDQTALTAIEVFEKNVVELTDELQALATVRHILMQLIQELQKAAHQPLHHLLSSNDALLSAVDALSLTGINLKGDQTMNELQKADKTLSRLTDVRIITLPPATVASAHFVGEEPETHTAKIIDAFVREHQLWALKPDFRHYGFNHPNPSDETGLHGYERWVTIPEDMALPAGLEKKRFPGGLYAAHMIVFPNFNEWEDLLQWVMQSKEWEFAGDFADQEHMCGMLDEHLNYVVHARQPVTEPEGTQFDLLMPVRAREK